MSLYFFINYLVRGYINRGQTHRSFESKILRKNDITKGFPEWSVYKNDMHINSINETNEIRNGPSKITSDLQLSKELSRLILLEANETGASDNKRYLYCELLFINREIHDMVKNRITLTPQKMRYLFIVYYHYTLDNSLVLLLNDLMKDQEFFMRLIKRIFKYPCFRDWIEIHDVIKTSKYEKLYETFRKELTNSNYLVHKTEKELIERQRSKSSWEILFT